MSATSHSGGGGEAWSVVTRDQEAVVAALARGECDGILADAWLEPDNLIQSALEEGFLDWFGDFPDRRQRRSIDKVLCCRVLLCKQLVDLRSVAQAGRVIFHAAALLDKLGFNFRQIREGGKRTGDYRPFEEEALEDYFAKLGAKDYLSHQLKVSRRLLEREELEGEVWLLDGPDTKIPNGHHTEGRPWKAGVLSVCTAGGPRPVLWNFGPAPATSDLALARPLVKAARQAWGPRRLRWLILDGGFVDGPWIRAQKEQGTEVVIRLKEGMDNYEVALRAAVRRVPWGAAGAAFCRTRRTLCLAPRRWLPSLRPPHRATLPSARPKPELLARGPGAPFLAGDAREENGEGGEKVRSGISRIL